MRENKKNDTGEKKIRSVETKGKATTITYEDGSTEIQHPGGVIHAETISGGISFNPNG